MFCTSAGSVPALVQKRAGQFVIEFSSPNPAAMERLDLDGGAASFEMRNLANANAAEITVDGGVASYAGDFGGVLQRDAQAGINVGVSSLEISVPAAGAAQIEANLFHKAWFGAT